MKAANFLGPILALSVLAGCNASGSGEPLAGAAEGAPVGSSSTPSASISDPAPTGASKVALGESCVSGDADKICLAMNFVTYQDSGGRAVASKAQAATILRKMNELFSQCGIGFQVEKYEVADPAAHGLSYGAASQNETDQIRREFSTDDDKLLAVTTGPWGTAVNAWTSMPGEGTYGAVMEASIVGYGDGIIYAHEFGHYLGLDHAGSSTNLMSPVISTNSTALTSAQCQEARQTVRSYWSAMTRD